MAMGLDLAEDFLNNTKVEGAVIFLYKYDDKGKRQPGAPIKAAFDDEMMSKFKKLAKRIKSQKYNTLEDAIDFTFMHAAEGDRAAIREIIDSSKSKKTLRR